MANAPPPPSGPAPSRDDRVDPQPALPLAPQIQENSSRVPHVDIPFQWLSASLTGEKDVQQTVSLSASQTLSKLWALYRHAELRSVEAEFVPTASSFSKPISISCAWTIASITPASGDETDYFGGRFLTIGGPVLLSSTTHIPCDLNSINPTLRSSVEFRDTPRVTFTARSVAGASANTPLAHFIIRGVLRLSGPSGAKFA